MKLTERLKSLWDNIRQRISSKPCILDSGRLIDQLLELPEHAELKKNLDDVGGWRNAKRRDSHCQQDKAKN